MVVKMQDCINVLNDIAGWKILKNLHYKRIFGLKKSERDEDL